MSKIDITIYTKEKGRLKLTKYEWIYLDRSKLTYHREDGPAREYANGDKVYYINGKLHREDGPAIEDADGYKAYYINGKLHREDGPARERVNGYKEYYINGNLIRKEILLLINNCTNKNELARYLLSDNPAERYLATLRGKQLWAIIFTLQSIQKKKES